MKMRKAADGTLALLFSGMAGSPCIPEAKSTKFAF
jgi:hypothetical protein